MKVRPIVMWAESIEEWFILLVARLAGPFFPMRKDLIELSDCRGELFGWKERAEVYLIGINEWVEENEL